MNRPCSCRTCSNVIIYNDFRPPKFVADFIIWCLGKIVGEQRLDRWTTPIYGTNGMGPK